MLSLIGMTKRRALLSTAACLASLIATGAAFGQSIPEIQGKGHVSPLVGQDVTTKGVVTAVGFNGFFMQDPDGDGDADTADGLFVFTSDAPTVEVGELIEATGVVSEFIPGGAGTGNLSTTQLDLPAITVLSSEQPLPAPVTIGRSGRVPPTRDVISADEIAPPINLQDAADDANNVFDPNQDGIDFYESLEGMLVTVEAPQAVSATRTFNAFSSEFFTLPNRGALVEPRNALTTRGGILLQPDPDNLGDQNPERVQIQLDGTLFPFDVPSVTVGDRLGDITGVMGYSFGNFEVNALGPIVIQDGRLKTETTRLRGRGNALTVASYNVLNLSPDGSDANQLVTLGGHIANNLGGPDILALQEIQDNSGETDDGVTDATQTLEALRAEVVAAGGPDYAFFDVAPADGASGGVPGGNIRNAFFFNPDRVSLVNFVSLTPEVLATTGISDPNAFLGTRDPLVGVFGFRSNEIIVVNNHLTSRFGSTPVYGGPQPFVQAGEAEREAQLGALNELANLVLEIDQRANIVVLGDLNTFQFTNDLETILPGEDTALTNLIPPVGSNRGLDRNNIYTFNFEGNSQVLDHVVVSDGLKQSALLDIVHVNVDFPRVDDTVGSDHEPLVARLQLSKNKDSLAPLF
ncbi:MAG: endonuclease/exonuclease/phosphatase family protein [Geminicoccales bacterium]